MLIGIILAGGKGTRINSKTRNKVTLEFLGKPIIQYGLELYQGFVDKTIVVVGAFLESVKEACKGFKVEFVVQNEQLGTGDAVKCALPLLKKLKAKTVFVGYGDHMMFYDKETLKNLFKLHKKEKSVMTFITTEYENPDELRWGRILRDKKGNVIGSVEHKDANEQQRKIKELNAGFYCFEVNFLQKYLPKLKPSPITGEYYLNALIDFAVKDGLKVSALKVPFEKVGIGVNTKEELERAEKLYLKISNAKAQMSNQIQNTNE